MRCPGMPMDMWQLFAASFEKMLTSVPGFDAEAGGRSAFTRRFGLRRALLRLRLFGYMMANTIAAGAVSLDGEARRRLYQYADHPFGF